jgi:hypothetical protein
MELLTIKKNNTTYDVENCGLGIGQAHQCGEIKPVSGTLPFDNWISKGNTEHGT